MSTSPSTCAIAQRELSRIRMTEEGDFIVRFSITSNLKLFLLLYGGSRKQCKFQWLSKTNKVTKKYKRYCNMGEQG